jgi:hypothetical protein
MPTTTCRAHSKAGSPCRRPASPGGWCTAHDPAKGQERAALGRQAGQASGALRSLAAEKVAAIARLGVDTLPDLSSVQAVQAYLVSVAARVESGALTTKQGTALAGLVRLSKDMLALETDIKLLEELEQAKKRSR